MEKYQLKFLEKISQLLTSWKEKPSVSHEDIYRFLHTIKGTAATIGMEDLSKVAEVKMLSLTDLNKEQWPLREWEQFLDYFIDLESAKVIEVPSNFDEEINSNEEKLILVVDDNLSLIRELKEEFEKQGFMVLVALNSEKALSILYSQNPDCVIIDLDLPNESAYHFLSTVLKKIQAHFIPIIGTSEDDQKSTRLKAYESGAVDVIAKPLDLEELLVRVRSRINYKEMISKAVLFDELTGTFNRKFLKMELERYLFEMKRTREPLSLVVIDLDRFKMVNDQYGHVVGDTVLKGFSTFILNNKRQSDYLIRYGGEEFILLLPQTKLTEANKLMERLLKTFRSNTFMSNEGKSFSVTFSAGVVEITDPSLQVEEHVRRADLALYEAKETGRDRVCVYGQDKETNSNGKVIHIGIIDDDTVVHELLEDRLKKLALNNYELDIQMFREGESFFASDWHTQSGKFLIILDGIMPRMDGLEVLQKLRAQYDEKKFVVLMLTGRKSEKDIVRALEIGADDYLTKPFNFGELEARIKRLIVRMMM